MTQNNYAAATKTEDQMNPKYAEDPLWSSKVNKYIDKIRNS